MGQSVVVINAGVEPDTTLPCRQSGRGGLFSTNDPAARVRSLCPAGVSASSDDNSSLPCPMMWLVASRARTLPGSSQADPGFEGIAPGAAIVSMQVFYRFDGTGQCADGGESCIAAFDSDLISALERAFELPG
jgi:hypothetical protein